ncbi:hypothetical protein ACGFNU_49905 [Spirillospora sp. NPDC048911]|uniref:hypothetical protein n=1 Tax=Spirillospora sp. NPDC048911 TaxID=3364527 RepID=UPI003723D25C
MSSWRRPAGVLGLWSGVSAGVTAGLNLARVVNVHTAVALGIFAGVGTAALVGLMAAELLNSLVKK